MKLGATIATLAILITAPVGAWGDPPPSPARPAGEGVQPTIAIIIDDMGANAVEGKRLIQLEQPLTLAFLPYRRYTTELATSAHRHRKEVMLHAPMDNTRHLSLGAGGLTTTMDRATLTTTLRKALRAIPHVKGVNNHMGSLLTQMPEPMAWIMEELEHYPLYFVDSRTIATTVAGQVAEEKQVPTLTRDVFLDHEQTEDYVHQQFRQLIRKARENGTAIAIGHPHTVTVDYLEKALPELDEQGIAVATVSAVWAMRNGHQRMFAEGEKREISPAMARNAED
ncbi:divergent polysaccharide deacetylase family protein [Marinobacter lacisalsi]|uniref:Divergent polysaccharide deacetylase family protein n=1 Tax=Marinobacter lacisalsi TaxID=475979 RepID=A0ABV8QEM3_9GAMM